MALNKFKGNQFTKKIEFGIDKKVENRNDGTMKQVYQRMIGPFFCAPYVRTMHQEFQLMGTKFQATRQVGVKHQFVGSKITAAMKYAVIDQKIYRIVDNSPDESGNPNAVDILSLQEAQDISLPEEVKANG